MSIGRLNEYVDPPQASTAVVDFLRAAALKMNALAGGRLAAVDATSTAMPTAGTFAKGDIVRNSAPSLSASAVVFGWLRLVSGSAHVAGTDWAALTVPAESMLPLAGGTITGNLTVNGNTTLGDGAADTVSTGGNLGVGVAASATAAEVLRMNSTASTYAAWYRSASRKAYVQSDASAGFLLVQEENLPMIFYTNNAICTRLDASGNMIQKVNATAPTLDTNSTMTFELTSNTELKIKVRGSDGTTRSVSLTLA